MLVVEAWDRRLLAVLVFARRPLGEAGDEPRHIGRAPTGREVVARRRSETRRREVGVVPDRDVVEVAALPPELVQARVGRPDRAAALRGPRLVDEREDPGPGRRAEARSADEA